MEPTTTPHTEPRLSQHPISAAFPAMLETDFTALVNDIRANGQRLPIMVYDNQVLDGRHRYRACQQLGIARSSRSSPAPIRSSVVLFLNLQRRHLTESQRAMVAAELANLDRGGDRRSTKFKGSREPSKKKACSIEDTAKKLDVSPKSVKRARPCSSTARRPS